MENSLFVNAKTNRLYANTSVIYKLAEIEAFLNEKGFTLGDYPKEGYGPFYCNNGPDRMMAVIYPTK